MATSEGSLNGVYASNLNMISGLNSACDSLPNDSWRLTPVPLPAGLLLFSSGFGLLGAFARRYLSV